VYLGSIDKSDSKQRSLLERTYARARCLLHPTTADTNPMVLIEAGYFGCPAISTRRYAIPELVVDGVSGLLLDDPTDVTALTNHMIWMLQPGERYRQMRREARTHMLGYYTREAFQRRLTAEISRVLCNT
jgi:glycosyltransferase involved in cell wall biosynthesis